MLPPAATGAADSDPSSLVLAQSRERHLTEAVEKERLGSIKRLAERSVGEAGSRAGSPAPP
jgi:hypothetical protein